MTYEQKLIDRINHASEREKEFIRRLIEVYASGNEAGKKILHEADLSKVTKEQDLWDILEAAERA